MADTVILWHNPSCGSSRNALEYLQDKGITPQIYLYLKEKPTRAVIEEMLIALGIPAQALLRPKEEISEELGLYGEGADQSAILDAMAEHPRLIQRPVVRKGNKAVIARPKSRIDEIL
jgi:arsenate reductase (glutaredoxin)